MIAFYHCLMAKILFTLQIFFQRKNLKLQRKNIVCIVVCDIILYVLIKNYAISKFLNDQFQIRFYHAKCPGKMVFSPIEAIEKYI